MSDLFAVKNSWLHYVGGSTYSSDQTFLTEAAKHGFSRRIPAQIARGMHFGDRLIFLRWNKGKPYAFAEARLSRISFDADIAEYVGQRLVDDGKATYTADGGTVRRQCGSYTIGGTWTVECTISEILELAFEASGGDTLFCMIGGTHVTAYDTPIRMYPSPKFTRGFTRLTHDAEFVPYDEERTQIMVAVENYRKKPRHRRLPGRGHAKQPALAFG